MVRSLRLVAWALPLPAPTVLHRGQEREPRDGGGRGRTGAVGQLGDTTAPGTRPHSQPVPCGRPPDGAGSEPRQPPTPQEFRCAHAAHWARLGT